MIGGPVEVYRTILLKMAFLCLFILAPLGYLFMLPPPVQTRPFPPEDPGYVPPIGPGNENIPPNGTMPGRNMNDPGLPR